VALTSNALWTSVRIRPASHPRFGPSGHGQRKHTPARTRKGRPKHRRQEEVTKSYGRREETGRRRARKNEKTNVLSAVALSRAHLQQNTYHHHGHVGHAISWSSYGMMGFKVSRKSTPYAAQMAAEDAGKKARDKECAT